MEYLRNRGTFADVPFATILDNFRTAYPAIVRGKALVGDFHAEAVAPTADD
jgi:hypothetical protein